MCLLRVQRRSLGLKIRERVFGHISPDTSILREGNSRGTGLFKLLSIGTSDEGITPNSIPLPRSYLGRK